MRSLYMGLLLAGLALAQTACVVRGHASYSFQAQGHVRAKEPPAPRYEEVNVAEGQIWVRGHWQRAADGWTWIAGHYEAQQANRVWIDGYWERTGRTWTWVEGRWSTSAPDVEITTAPPAPRVETVANLRGHIWIRGYWRHAGGAWTWVPGHYEREHASEQWVDGHWEQRGRSWHWIEGNWSVHVRGGGEQTVPARVK